MDYRDAGHRPHAIHTGETPTTKITRGPEGISVTLDSWGPVDNLFTTMYDALQSNWGESPNRSALQPCRRIGGHVTNGQVAGHWCDPAVALDCQTGWCRLTDAQRDYVESCFRGKTLSQILEMLTFHFTVDGVARVFTHQFVRTRIGAGFMQHGGRDNDWRHRGWTMPETIHRACDLFDNTEGHSEIAAQGLSHCITDPNPIDRYLDRDASNRDYRRVDAKLRDAIESHLEDSKRLYAALVDSGIPWQDARRVLPMGSQTYIHAVYNYLALQGVCNKRMEFAMDWEINAVAQLMVREVRMKCHPLIGKYLQSLSDKLGVAAFAGLESWTPDGKHPVPTDKQDLPRLHRPEQAPFWVLHPDSMAGGPIVWVPTNGTYPESW